MQSQIDDLFYVDSNHKWWTTENAKTKQNKNKQDDLLIVAFM